MACPQCGAQNRPEAKFCRGCGHMLEPGMDTMMPRSGVPAAPLASSPASTGERGARAVVAHGQRAALATRRARRQLAALALVAVALLGAVAWGHTIVDARRPPTPTSPVATVVVAALPPTVVPTPTPTRTPPPTATATATPAPTPLTTATPNPAPTQTRAAELAQLATLTAPTMTPTSAPTPYPTPPLSATVAPSPTATPRSIPTSSPTLTPTATTVLATTGDGPGGELLYASDKEGVWALYDLRGADGGERRLTNLAADNYNGVWSPDGGRIAFVSERDGNPELYVMGADGTNQRRLTNAPGVDNSPAWSPDGKSLAFVSDRGGGGAIYLLTLDSGAAARLVNTPAGWPAWSRRGDIAFTRATGAVLGLYATSLDAPGVTPLANVAGSSDDTPAFSPDGTRLAVASGPQQDDRQIVVMDLTGRNRTALTARGADTSDPVWSPDGAWLAYTSTVGGTQQIYLMRTDGSRPRPITKGPGKKWYLSWKR